MLSANLLERRLQVAAIALLTGLVVEVLCLLGKGPIAFLLFSGVGAVLFAAGILLYLQIAGVGLVVCHATAAARHAPLDARN